MRSCIHSIFLGIPHEHRYHYILKRILSFTIENKSEYTIMRCMLPSFLLMLAMFLKNTIHVSSTSLIMPLEPLSQTLST